MPNPSLLNQISLQFPEAFNARRDDLSAILLTAEKYLFLGSDETSTLERLTRTNDKSFTEHKHFEVSDYIDLPEPPDEEIDIEGLFDTQHYLWLVGSHSWKRKRPKDDKTDIKNIKRLTTIATEANRYILGRIPLIDGELYKTYADPENPEKQLTAAKLELTPGGNILTEALKDDPHLGMFVSSSVPSKDNGFDIEGLAVEQNRIFLGLRGPVLRGWATLLELEVQETSPELLTLKPMGEEGKLYKKHFINLQGLGIRDLCFDGEDMLILAGPTMDLDGPVKLFRLPNAKHLDENTLSKPEAILDIPFGEGEDHAEGIALFDSIAQQHSLLVVYDSPAQERLEGESGVKADVFAL